MPVSVGCCGLLSRRRRALAGGARRAEDDGEEWRRETTPVEYDDNGFDREDTTTSRRSTFSLEDEDEGGDYYPARESTTMSAISVQSSFSLEDEDMGRPKGPSWGERVIDLDQMVPQEASGSLVLINLYDFGGIGSMLNKTVFASMGMGVYHCAVEVYSTEWSFVFHKERSRNNNSTGVVQNKPQRLRNHNFNQSIEVGWTAWNEEDVRKEVRRLSHQWRARSYHVTRRNCITFAEEFVSRLGLAEHFPAWVKKAPELGRDNAALSAVIDNTWEVLAGVEPSVEPICGVEDDEICVL